MFDAKQSVRLKSSQRPGEILGTYDGLAWVKFEGLQPLTYTFDDLEPIPEEPAAPVFQPKDDLEVSQEHPVPIFRGKRGFFIFYGNPGSGVDGKALVCLEGSCEWMAVKHLVPLPQAQKPDLYEWMNAFDLERFKHAFAADPADFDKIKDFFCECIKRRSGQ